MSNEEPVRETETCGEHVSSPCLRERRGACRVLDHNLRVETPTAKIAFLWLNIELHGCRATALETM
jgi:hypothetical protein